MKTNSAGKGKVPNKKNECEGTPRGSSMVRSGSAICLGEDPDVQVPVEDSQPPAGDNLEVQVEVQAEVAAERSSTTAGTQTEAPCTIALGPGKLVLLENITDSKKKQFNGRHAILRKVTTTHVEVELRVCKTDTLITVPRSCATALMRPCTDCDPTEVMNVLLRAPEERRREILYDLQGSLEDPKNEAFLQKHAREVQSLEDKLTASQRFNKKAKSDLAAMKKDLEAATRDQARQLQSFQDRLINAERARAKFENEACLAERRLAEANQDRDRLSAQCDTLRSQQTTEQDSMEQLQNIEHQRQALQKEKDQLVKSNVELQREKDRLAAEKQDLKDWMRYCDDQEEELDAREASLEAAEEALAKDTEHSEGEKQRLARQKTALEAVKQEIDHARTLLERDQDQHRRDTQAQMQSVERQRCDMEKDRADLARERKSLEQERAQFERLRSQFGSQRQAAGTKSLQWEWNSDDGWQPYSQPANKQLLDALFAGRARVQVETGGQSYICDLRNSRQTNEASGKRRCIQLAGLPKHWCSGEDVVEACLGGRPNPVWDAIRWQLPGSPLSAQQTGHTKSLLLPRPDLTDKFQRVLRETCYHTENFNGVSDCTCMVQAKVVSVDQIINLDQMRKYQAFKERLAVKSQNRPHLSSAIRYEVKAPLRGLEEEFDMGGASDPKIRERWLFHGTRDESPIVREGFDLRLARDGRFGRGMYFACQSCKSLTYCNGGHSAGVKTMILARVALGDVHVLDHADSKLTRPLWNQTTGEHFDSLIAPAGKLKFEQTPGNWADFVQFHQEFIVFDNCQANPEFVVKFRIAAPAVGIA